MFTNKVVVDLVQQFDENNKFAGVEEEEILEHSPEKLMEMLNKGPCQIMFNRVYSGGIRTMRCVKPEFPSSRNAFDPRFPSLISVMDLDKGDWRSFYYEQVMSFKRIRKATLNYEQRKISAVLRGEDWDYLYPGPEGYSLRGEEQYESFSKFREEFILKPLLRRKSRMSR
jgi:hypothetical protein